MMKKTKIICTIGPASESEDILAKLLNAGMDGMRLNFSHGNYYEHENRILKLRKVMKTCKKQAIILIDTKGPEIRTMHLYNKDKVFLRAGQKFIFTTDNSVNGNNCMVAINYVHLINDISVGETILVDDGLICMKVKNITKNRIICTVLNDGFLGENKSINVPGVSVKLPIPTKQDKCDLIFACRQKIDFVAVSFVRSKKDVESIRAFLDENNGEDIQIISKIETKDGLNNFDEILTASDGIMIARGDLGVDIPMEDVILAQKMIIKKCNAAKKIVVTATHMLNSMINNPRPTRAEAGDVANAVIDGTDVVMLSGESANGLYPVEATSVMSKICVKTESVVQNYYSGFKDITFKSQFIDLLSKSVVDISNHLNISLIVVFTENGKCVRSIRKYCPNATVLALTSNKNLERQLLLVKGVEIEVLDYNVISNINNVIKKTLTKRNIIIKNKYFILVKDNTEKNLYTTNTFLQFQYIKFK